MTFGTVKVRVLFFAKAREFAGINKGEEDSLINPRNLISLILADLSLPQELKASELLTFICAEFNLENFKNNLILALNKDYVETDDEPVFLKEGDELAVIPPISGG